MTTAQQLDKQWGRKVTLLVAGGDSAIDLSELRIKFMVRQSDEESPNTLDARIYNLSEATVKKITEGAGGVEFTRVILQAGYQSASFGVIFDGTIKQFRKGRENATDTYLDILAAAGDIEYNFGVCCTTLASGSSSSDRVKAIAGQMGLGVHGAANTSDLPGFSTGGTLPRGKVLWGMGRAMMRNEAANLGATWSIQDGQITVVPLASYLPGEAVVLSSLTGMIGVPEQTQQGIKVRCLLNPKIRIAGLVQIDNASINQISQADLRASGFPVRNLPVGQQPFDRRAGQPQLFADVTSDGFYRVYVVEFTGDIRGAEWYADIICLAVDKSSNKVLAQ